MANTVAGNQAAWLYEKQGKPLKVDHASSPSPDADEVIVKVGALAINPVDWKIQDYGMFIQDFPNILGADAAGEITEVGSDVKAFKKGDRVLTHCASLLTGKPKHGGFQKYVAGKAQMTAHIPSSFSYTEATVLPLAISTASAGLFQKDYLELPVPQLSGAKDSGKVIAVWGGSSSVGTTVLQLCKAAGVTTVATASKHNHDFVKSLGATHVVDYNSSSVVDDVVKAVKETGKEFAGVYDSISTPETLKPSSEIIQKAGGAKRLATVLPGADEHVPKDIKVGGVFAFTIFTQQPDVGKAVWGDFVEGALKNGALKPLPEPVVVGKGLENVQKGMDMNKKGVSAKKVVIEL